MFESMDQVAWADLWACGPATDVPRLIRTLASSTDRAERATALAELNDRVIYQGLSILEVTPYAVPFLLELLTVETLEEHADLFALLAMIAKGAPFAVGAGALDRYADEASAPPELQARLAEERGWVRRAYAAIEQGVPTCLPFLTPPEADTRMWAAYLLSLFPGQAPVVVPALHARLVQEDDALVQAALVASLGALLTSGAALRQFAQMYLRTQNPLLVRCVAALAAARRAGTAGTATPAEVVQVLLEAVAARETVAPAFEQLPQIHDAEENTMTAHVCETLARLDPAQAIPALIEVQRAFSSAAADQHGHGQDPELWDLCTVARSLLAAAFTHGEPPDGVHPPTPPVLPLTQAQRMALSALVEDEVLWRSYPQLGGYQVEELRGVYLHFGLPTAREALGALLRAH